MDELAIYTISVVVSVFVVMIIIYFAIFWRKTARKKEEKKQASIEAWLAAQYPVDFSRLKIIELLGSGNFSHVFLVWFHPTADQPISEPIRVAAKLLVPRIDPQTVVPTYNFACESIQCLYDETIVRQLEHENILRTYGLCRNFEIPLVTGGNGKIKTVATVLEYMDLRDCESFIRKYHCHFTELQFYSVLFSIFLDVSNAMVYLEEKRIVHRDIAPRNIFLGFHFRSNRPHVIAKMGDFGLAKETKTEITMNGHSYFGYFGGENEQLDATILAPEAKTCRLFTSQSDVYSFGVAILDCLQLIQVAESREARQVSNCRLQQCDEIVPVHGQSTIDISNYSPIQQIVQPLYSGESRCILGMHMQSIELKHLALLCMKTNVAERISPKELRTYLEILLKKYVEPMERL